MGVIRSWLRGRLKATSTTVKVDLIGTNSTHLSKPAPIGISTALPLEPWSASRLGSIFRQLQHVPAEHSIFEARFARHCLSRFWLQAPIDLLETFYRGEIGELQRSLMQGPLIAQPLAADESLWFESICEKLVDPAFAAARNNLLMAGMAYFSNKPAALNTHIEQAPQWLVEAFSDHFALDQALLSRNPIAYLAPPTLSDDVATAADPARSQATLQPTDLSEILVTNIRGEEAFALFNDEKTLEKMRALINLYTVDPSDQEALLELAGLREIMAQLWLDVNPSQLQQLYFTAVGDIFKMYMNTGFSSELVNDNDLDNRMKLAQHLASLDASEAAPVLLATLLYSPTGKMSIEGRLDMMPGWLLEELNQLNLLKG